MKKLKLLILCTGNSCRSQMAHAILQSLDPGLLVRSAGTQPADRVHPFAVQVMKEIGIDISSRVPELVDTYAGEDWDYVITVCGDARESCPVFSGKVKTRLHIGFEDPSRAVGDEAFVLDEFRRIRDEIRVAFEDFYSVCRNG